LKNCGGVKSPHKNAVFMGNPDNPPTVFFDLPALRRRFKTAFGR